MFSRVEVLVMGQTFIFFMPADNLSYALKHIREVMEEAGGHVLTKECAVHDAPGYFRFYIGRTGWQETLFFFMPAFNVEQARQQMNEIKHTLQSELGKVDLVDEAEILTQRKAISG